MHFLWEKNDIVLLFISHGTGLAPKPWKKLSSVKKWSIVMFMSGPALSAALIIYRCCACPSSILVPTSEWVSEPVWHYRQRTKRIMHRNSQELMRQWRATRARSHLPVVIRDKLGTISMWQQTFVILGHLVRPRGSFAYSRYWNQRRPVCWGLINIKLYCMQFENNVRSSSSSSAYRFSIGACPPVHRMHLEDPHCRPVAWPVCTGYFYGLPEYFRNGWEGRSKGLPGFPSWEGPFFGLLSHAWNYSRRP